MSAEASRRNQRGVTLVEILVATLIGAVVLLGVVGLYRGFQASFIHTNSQAVLQRQGTLALEAIARQARRGTAIVQDTCVPAAPGGTTGRTFEITVTDTVPPALADWGRYCYYAGNGANAAPLGALCERFTPGATPNTPGGCRNLVAEGQGALARGIGITGIRLLQQPGTPDVRCPRHADTPATQIAAPLSCLAIFVGPNSDLNLAFATTDGLNVMTFNSTLTLRN